MYVKFTAESSPSLRKPMTEERAVPPAPAPAPVAPGASRRERVPKAQTKGGETKSMQNAEMKRRFIVDGWSRSCRNEYDFPDFPSSKGSDQM